MRMLPLFFAVILLTNCSPKKSEVKKMFEIGSEIKNNNLATNAKHCIPDASFGEENFQGLEMYDLTVWTCSNLKERSASLSRKICYFKGKVLIESVSIGLEEVLVVNGKISDLVSKYTDTTGVEKEVSNFFYKRSDLKRDYKDLLFRYKDALKKTLDQSRRLKNSSN